MSLSDPATLLSVLLRYAIASCLIYVKSLSNGTYPRTCRIELYALGAWAGWLLVR